MALVSRFIVWVILALLVGGSALAAGVRNDAYRLFKPGGNDVKWGQPALGKGAKITYDIVRFRQPIPHVHNCPDLRPVDSLLRRSNVERSEFELELARAFATWQSVANVEFRRASPGAVAQILIGAQGRPAGRAYTDIAYARPNKKGAPSQIRRALICLNPMVGWKIGFNSDLSVYDLRYTFLHEIGHAIGLDHPGASGSVMGFRYNEVFRTLQPGDIEGAKYLYGGPIVRPKLRKPMLAASDQRR